MTTTNTTKKAAQVTDYCRLVSGLRRRSRAAVVSHIIQTVDRGQYGEAGPRSLRTCIPGKWYDHMVVYSAPVGRESTGTSTEMVRDEP